jgi:hypothetical protein
MRWGGKMKLKLERMSHATLSLLELHYYFRDNGGPSIFRGGTLKRMVIGC